MKQIADQTFFRRLAGGRVENPLKPRFRGGRALPAGQGTRFGAARARAILGLPARCRPGALLAANEAGPDDGPVLYSANDGAAACAAFEILQPDGFRVPFGDYPVDAYCPKTGRKIPALQRVDAQSANDMVSALSAGFLGRKGRAPVYIGHPDVPGNEQRWPDKTAYGWIKGGSVSADGVVFAVNYGARGRSLVDDGAFMFYSPLFALRLTGETSADGRPVCRPVALKSMGLVNESNIPVPPLVAVNEDGETRKPDPADAGGQPPKGNEMTPEQLKALLAALGLADTADAAAALDAAKALAAERDQLKQQLAEAAAKASQADAAAANERKARYGAILDQAIADKRITAAQRPGWEKLFGADFAAANESLGAIAAPVCAPQSSACRGRPRAGSGSARSAAAEQFAGLVQAKKALLRTSLVGANEHALHQAAWNAAAAEHKDVFDLMSSND